MSAPTAPDVPAAEWRETARSVSLDSRDEGPEGRFARAKLRWWREIVYVFAFYSVYSLIRNQLGSAGQFESGAGRALRNAELVIDAERAVGLFVEESVQKAFLGWDWFIRFWNIFYGSFHFVVTAAVLIFLFHRFPARYRRYRNVLAFTTALGLVGFVLFPLMPPRLLDAGPPFGANLVQYDFVDTLHTIGGLWSFGSGAMSKVSNQWAAMPSLHIAWATWCLMATWPVLRRQWTRVLFSLYPVATLFAIVVTANHYWLDAVGGLIVLLAGWWLGNAFTNRLVPSEILDATAAMQALSQQTIRTGAAVVRGDRPPLPAVAEVEQAG
jgi:PAP2 superfamily